MKGCAPPIVLAAADTAHILVATADTAKLVPSTPETANIYIGQLVGCINGGKATDTVTYAQTRIPTPIKLPK